MANIITRWLPGIPRIYLLTGLVRTLVALLLVSSLLGCDDDDDDNGSSGNLKLDISGLADLGSGYAYEGWIMVNGTPVSTGVFTVNSNGQLSISDFQLNSEQLNNATSFILTIEPVPDPDPAPSNIHLVAGDFSGNNASLSVGHMTAIGNDFADATGSYILATPTDGMNTNEKSGVWFLNPDAGPGPALTLPTLPAGWKYEGWAVINAAPVTTGKFTTPSGADEDAPYSGTMPGPPFPGEDFLMNAPSGLTFPLDLSGQKIVITIEPEPDNSSDPFLLKPLAGDVPANSMDGTSYSLTNNVSASFPSGAASRESNSM
jgi:hypothetical protein